MARLKAIKPRIGVLAPRIGLASGDEAARLRERDATVGWHAWVQDGALASIGHAI